MYRLIVESLLGLRLEGDKLRLAPCLPASWPGFKLRYRYGDTRLPHRGACAMKAAAPSTSFRWSTIARSTGSR